MAKKGKAGRMKVLLAFVLLFAPALLLIFISTRSCEHKFKELDDYGEINAFEFKDAQGKIHSSDELKGNILLISVLQTNCPDDCAVSLWHIKEHIYKSVYGSRKKQGGVRMLSFVTDEQGNMSEDVGRIDEMLQDQIPDYDPELWMVAAGNAEEVYDIEHNGQSLLQEGDAFYGGKAFQELMLLIDRDGHLRMVLPGKSEGMVRRMKQHVALLMKQYDKLDAKEK